MMRYEPNKMGQIIPKMDRINPTDPRNRPGPTYRPPPMETPGEEELSRRMERPKFLLGNSEWRMQNTSASDGIRMKGPESIDRAKQKRSTRRMTTMKDKVRLSELEQNLTRRQ